MRGNIDTLKVCQTHFLSREMGCTHPVTGNYVMSCNILTMCEYLYTFLSVGFCPQTFLIFLSTQPHPLALTAMSRSFYVTQYLF